MCGPARQHWGARRAGSPRRRRHPPRRLKGTARPAPLAHASRPQPRTARMCRVHLDLLWCKKWACPAMFLPLGRPATACDRPSLPDGCTRSLSPSFLSRRLTRPLTSTHYGRRQEQAHLKGQKGRQEEDVSRTEREKRGEGGRRRWTRATEREIDCRLFLSPYVPVCVPLNSGAVTLAVCLGSCAHAWGWRLGARAPDWGPDRPPRYLPAAAARAPPQPPAAFIFPLTPSPPHSLPSPPPPPHPPPHPAPPITQPGPLPEEGLV